MLLNIKVNVIIITYAYIFSNYTLSLFVLY
jgi:hypothetical protein